MNGADQRFNCTTAKAIDMVDYLAKAGHQPQRIRDKDYWYLSPLRNEKTASFKINRKINRWYDHGMGKGGNLIDFALLYHNCKISEWLQSLNGNFLSHETPPISEKTKEKLITIERAFPLTSPGLLNYLKQRNISFSTAHVFCVEVQYKFGEKIYFGIGFKNDLGGYEIRNPFYKNSSSPKGITTIKNTHQKVAVFEGFFDFLSFISMPQNPGSNPCSFCILNSLSFFETARPFLEAHDSIQLFLDNDKAGKNCAKYALQLHGKYIDGSKLYKGFKDINEWWQTKKPPS
jgi:DNA primase